VSDDDELIELGEPDEIPVYNQSMNVIAELKSRVRELEAERDRLKAEVNRQKRLDLSGECDRLRARHAALVEAFEQAEGEHPLSCEYADDARYTWPDRWAIIKAALAEVKSIK
jgi:hypothetical protein